MTQRVDWKCCFAYTEDGGNPLYRGGTSLEGRKYLTRFYQVCLDRDGGELAARADFKEIVDFQAPPAIVPRSSPNHGAQ